MLLDIEDGEFIGRLPEQAELEIPSPLRTSRPFWLWFSGLGTVVAVALMALFWPADLAPVPQQVDQPGTDSLTEKSNDTEQPISGGADQSEQPDNTTAQLEHIYESIHGFHGQHGRYPNGTSDDGSKHQPRWSWIAELHKGGLDDGVVPAWERPWNDPANNAFVRRQLPDFRNQQVAKSVGNDRYPASNFAGLTGVGRDSPELPVRHPRAGVFSTQRVTRLSDILDGTANTIMVVGVQEHLGSWSRPGQATMRGFNQEPYVNGPDGIGTGQNDSMLVLMADGSVRQVSNQVAGKIARRMATIADGMTLDPTTPGDPLLVQTEDDANEPDKTLLEQDIPITAELAPDSPAINVGQRLQQEILLYSLEQPAKLVDVLLEFQEFTGVPFDTTGLPVEIFDAEVSLTAKDVKFSELLSLVLKPAGLKYEIAPATIRIVRDDTHVESSTR